jgi:hypothetical protein
VKHFPDLGSNKRFADLGPLPRTDWQVAVWSSSDEFMANKEIQFQNGCHTNLWRQLIQHTLLFPKRHFGTYRANLLFDKRLMGTFVSTGGTIRSPLFRKYFIWSQGLISIICEQTWRKANAYSIRIFSKLRRVSLGAVFQNLAAVILTEGTFLRKENGR